MTEWISLPATKDARAALERAAATERLSLEDFILRAAAQRARDVDAAVAYFAARAARADLADFERVFSPDRPGGEPPQPGDELP